MSTQGHPINRKIVWRLASVKAVRMPRNLRVNSSRDHIAAKRREDKKKIVPACHLQHSMRMLVSAIGVSSNTRTYRRNFQDSGMHLFDQSSEKRQCASSFRSPDFYNLRWPAPKRTTEVTTSKKNWSRVQKNMFVAQNGTENKMAVAILAQVLGSSYSVLRSRPVVRCVQCRRVLEGSRRIRGRKVAGKEMAEQDMEYTLHIHHCWTKKMKNLFQHAHLGMQNPSVVMVSPWRRWQE